MFYRFNTKTGRSEPIEARPKAEPKPPGLDVRLIPTFLAAGWLLVTLGLWGGLGERWWIWPLSVGLGFLAVGLCYGWAFWKTIAAAPKITEGEPESGPRRVAR